MKLKDLEDTVKDFKNGQSAIETNRSQWNKIVKKLLNVTLRSVIEHYKLHAEVQEVNLYKNYEAVNLTFGNHRSGITKEKPDETKHFNKFGGTLSFSQSYNGNIDVIILYPHIEEITTLTDKEVITQISPSELNEDFILKQVNKFLTELINWEKSPQVPTVGYRFPKYKATVPKA